MKTILVVIPPHCLYPLLNQLDEHQLPGLSVSEVHRLGQANRGFTSSEKATKLLEISCEEEDAQTVMNVIHDVANAAHNGNGKTFVFSMTNNHTRHPDPDEPRDDNRFSR